VSTQTAAPAHPGAKMTAGEIIDRCGPFIRLLAGRAARRFQDDVEDWVQDVNLEIVRSAHTYDARRASMLTWVKLRARRLVSDRLRPARKRNGMPRGSRPLPFDPIEKDVADRIDHATDVERADLFHKARELIADLPEKERTVILRRLERDETNTEIAFAMGLSSQRIHQLRQSALARLAHRLRTAA
jgi:RNA polymerase sigma factor (sigma-70 family)